MVGVRVKDIRCAGKLSNGHWAGFAGSIAVSARTLMTFSFGFQPKVPLYFRWHIRFRPNVLRHFQLTFGFG